MQYDSAIHILLVEDNIGDARLFREALSEVKNVQFELIHVARLGDALQRLEQQPIDVILLDLSLPDSHGADTFFNLHMQYEHIPIIVLTSLIDETFAVRVIGSGAQDYLIKGQINGQAVMRTIRYAIERQGAQLALRIQSLTDELTGLYNRRGFFVHATQLIKLAHRLHTPLLVIYLDVDGLKQVNDTLGHDVGSRLLVDAAHILHRTFRETDIISRFGGDEFVILGLDSASHDRDVIINRLQHNITSHNDHIQRPYKISMSLGVVSHDPYGEHTLDVAIQRADQAMYLQNRIDQWLAKYSLFYRSWASHYSDSE